MTDRESIYTVTYIEGSPEYVEDLAQGVRECLSAALSAPGRRESYSLQRLHRAHHFALASCWESLNAWEAYASHGDIATLDQRMANWLLAPLDSRAHVALSVGEGWDTALGDLFAITHIDVTPPNKDTGTALVREFADAHRGKGGNQRIDALTQTNRDNHMTVIEAWADNGAHVGHMTADHTRAFREALHPLCGALYDERLYRRLA